MSARRRQRLDALQIAIDAIEKVAEEDRKKQLWTSLRDRWFTLLVKPILFSLTPQEINETLWLETRLFRHG